jgi:hypothetical protein
MSIDLGMTVRMHHEGHQRRYWSLGEMSLSRKIETPAQNREEFKQTIAMVLNAFPDYRQTIHDWITENDKTVTR